MFVICVDSRKALIAEFALKQFSTLSDTPRNRQNKYINDSPSSTSPSKASQR